MGTDIKTFKSHPGKFLFDHIQGVRKNVKQLTNSKMADLIAIFHDLGKINPYFQDKLTQKTGKGYSNHSYLSAFAFFCAFCSFSQNRKVLEECMSITSLTTNDIIAYVVLIAKHHGNLPDFCPKDHCGAGASILSEDEIAELFNFVNTNIKLPIYEYVSQFFSLEDFTQSITNSKAHEYFRDKLIFDFKKNQFPLDFFLNTQFAFASVIQADKADAGGINNIFNDQPNDILKFSKEFSLQLDIYLSKLNQCSQLNKLRTNIRNHAVRNIQKLLSKNEYVFELTAPTGSGKTLMLLTLASEIIRAKGPKRIIYALPFLSITEQVELEILKIVGGQKNYIQRVDSKSENEKFELLQKKLDSEVTEETLHELNLLEFQENTFAYPLVITTFVRFFETLLSNSNSELLKLPNFSNAIFLIDEIQALPPRLYGFFVAYITKFCRKFNSYAIISTATQPNFQLPDNNTDTKEFFFDYVPPTSLLPLSYFENDLFNRYKIEYNSNPISLDTLKEQILSENSSVLVILNTIDDTKELYNELKQNFCSEELLLLNTHFTPRHRKIKIYLAKRRLRQNKRVILISTQLIEAGVDIDFPVLYRDFATVASIVQSAGRCNRNGELSHLGKVVLLRLERNGKARSEIIYQGKDKDILTFTKHILINDSYQEKELLQVQQEFFHAIQSKLLFARYGNKLDDDFLKDIKECMFEKIGRFQLIDKQIFGEELRYYIPRNNSDSNFELLLSMHNELMSLFEKKSEKYLIKLQKDKMKTQLKKMSNQIVQIHLKNDQYRPEYEDKYFDIYKIGSDYYTFENGIDLQGGESII